MAFKLIQRRLELRALLLLVGFWAILFWAALKLSGCGDPLVVPMALPGNPPAYVAIESDGCGEQASVGDSVPTTRIDYTITPAEPTRPGETRMLASGLTLSTLQPGDGPVAHQGQTAVVHYVGTLAGGLSFDSSRERGKPFSFVLGAGEVIRGFELGVAGMRVGETRRLRIPPALGFGTQGRPPVLPPNTDLLFEVELLELH